MEPFNYLCMSSGKELRKLLMAAFNRWLNIPEITLNKISNVLQMLHNASLMYVIYICYIFVDYYILLHSFLTSFCDIDILLLT